MSQSPPAPAHRPGGAPVWQPYRHINGHDRKRAVGLSTGHQRLDVFGEISPRDGAVDGYRDPAALARINTQHPPAIHEATIAHTVAGCHTNGPAGSAKLPPLMLAHAALR